MNLYIWNKDYLVEFFKNLGPNSNSSQKKGEIYKIIVLCNQSLKASPTTNTK